MARPSSITFKDLRRGLLLVNPNKSFSKSVEWIPSKHKPKKPPPPSSPRAPLPKLESIKIPTKIERSPTDVLKALASTVKRDYTAPQYKFHDDPYLIPYSNLSKRSYALSKEAGKKAAKWVRQEHADLFQHQEAEPPIEAFFPTPVFTEESNVTEADLMKYVSQGFYPEATQIFEIMKLKGTEISQESKQAFIELLCFYNETEPLDDDLVEERWYKSSASVRDRMKNSWKDRGLAESLFQELENPNIGVCCAMIRGRAKYFQAERAWQLYKDVQSRGLLLDTNTYNSLIRVARFLKESSDMRWSVTEEVLQDMQQNGVTPNIGTFNAVLDVLSVIGNVRQSKSLCLSTFSEFRRLGIEPSLGSYYYLLMSFCKERGPASTILADILRELDGKELQIRDPKDTFFFVTAMDIARNHLQNVDLAHKVDKLLHTGNNYDLIGDSFKEAVYYRHYMALQCVSEVFDKFMEYYNKVVPNVYVPEPGIMEEILKSLEINQAIDYLPQLWSDIIIFDQSSRESILSQILQIMSAYYPTSVDFEVSQPAKLSEQFTEISWKIWTIIETQEKDRPRQIAWTGKMLGDLLTLQVKGQNFENASLIIRRLISSSVSGDVLGIPSLESLKLFLHESITLQNGAFCLACLQYINECGFPEIIQLSEETYSKVKLDSVQVAKLINIVGFDITTSSKSKGEQKAVESSI